MFSQTVEYALRAMVYLAADAPAPRTTGQIAERTRVPRGYLAKVLQQLARSKLVGSQRGLHGGFTLTHDPAEITVLAVVNAVDPIRRIRECPLGLKTHGKNLCPLHRRLDDALAQIEGVFAQTTLADVLADPSPRKPLCDVTVEGQAT